MARLSGAEIGLRRFLASTDAIEATVLLAEDGPLVDSLRDAGASVEVLPMAERTRGLTRAEVPRRAANATALADSTAYTWRLARRLRELAPDIVHTNSLKSGVYGSPSARLARLPVVWHLHDRMSPDYLPRRVVRPLRLLASTVPSALVVPSAYTLATVGHRFRPGLKTAVIPFPVPLAEQPHVLSDEVRTVGIVGRLTPWKGQHVFLDAFAQAFPAGPVRARVIGSAMFGEDDYANQLREQARGLGIVDRVDFVGFTSDVPAELERLDLLVHASVLADPLTTVVLEGMAAGIPVISADIGGHAEHIRDGQEGLLHTAGDAESLARVLRRGADDGDLRARIAAGGRTKAREFGPAAVVERMLDLYRRVLGQRAL